MIGTGLHLCQLVKQSKNISSVFKAKRHIIELNTNCMLNSKLTVL